MAFTMHSSNDFGTLFAGAESIHAGSPAFPDHQSATYQPISALQPDASVVAVPSSDLVNTTTNAPVVDSKSWATKEDWVAHRPLIKQLYHDQKKPLKEVMRFMEDQYGFRATVKMYKSHITQWGLDKKNKEFEMRAIVRKNKQRADQGKRSVIRVRGQLRDFAEVVRYWARKGISIDDIVGRQTASPTPEAVQVSTPVPSPIMTPQVLAIPEQILRCISDYFIGSFESGTWVGTEPTQKCYNIKTDGRALYTDDLVQGCYLACSLLQRRLIHEAGKTLIIATSKIKQILLAEDPLSLIELLSLLSYIRRQERNEIALIVLRQISAMGQVLLGSEHPVSSVSRWLSWTSSSDFDDVVTKCMENMIDQFARFVGPLHWSTVYSRTEFIINCSHYKDTSVQMLQTLLGKCESELQPYDTRTLFSRGNLAAELYSKRQYAEAETLSQQNIHYTRNTSTSTMLHNEAEGFNMIARCQYALGEIDLAIATLHQAIDSAVSRWGKQDGQPRRWLVRLEEWYGEQGLWGSAAQVRERWWKTLESMDVD